MTETSPEQSPLKDAALQAWEQHLADEAAEDEAEEQAQIDAARTHLVSVLGDHTLVDSLTVADTTSGTDWKLTVFTDGSLRLGVWRDSKGGLTVELVEPTDTGEWKHGPVIGSLWELGKLLESRENATAEAWAAGVDYAVGDRVTYDGVVYECIKAHTSKADSTEPPSKPDLWAVA